MTQKTNLGLWILTVLFSYSAPGFAADVVISTKDKKFSTKEVSVSFGDALVFKNDEADGTVHSIYSLTPGYEFDLKAQKPGETKTFASCPRPICATIWHSPSVNVWMLPEIGFLFLSSFIR